MKTNERALKILMVFISLLDIGMASTSDSDNMRDILELSSVGDGIETDRNQAMNKVLTVDDTTKDVEIAIDVKNTTYYEQAIFVSP